MTRDDLLDAADAYAEQLVNIGDMQAFYEVFGSHDPDFDINQLSTETLRYIFDNYLADEYPDWV